MSILDIPVTSFLLKKHPHCVETIKRLRGYVGNLQNWQYTVADVQTFNKKAEKVRKIAESVYDMFKVYNIFKIKIVVTELDGGYMPVLIQLINF